MYLWQELPDTVIYEGRAYKVETDYRVMLEIQYYIDKYRYEQISDLDYYNHLLDIIRYIIKDEIEDGWEYTIDLGEFIGAYVETINGEDVRHFKDNKVGQLETTDEEVLKSLGINREIDTGVEDKEEEQDEGVLSLEEFFFAEDEDIEDGEVKYETVEDVYDLTEDWGVIYSSFMSQYNINLMTAELHWIEFVELLRGLGGETPFKEVVRIRGTDLSTIKDKEERRYYREMKRELRLSTQGRRRKK